MQKINTEYLPQLITKLEEIMSWNSFALSLVNQYRSKGGLSEKQMSSAQAMLDKMAVNKSKAESLRKSFNTKKIEDLFAVALSNGLKRPRFHCGDVILSLASEQSKNKGAIYVKHKDTNEYGHTEKNYVGKIMNNVCMPILRASKEAIDTVMSIADDPLKSAINHGKMSNHCSMCDKELTVDRSIKNGYGKKCAENWGFPY